VFAERRNSIISRQGGVSGDIFLTGRVSLMESRMIGQGCRSKPTG